MLSRDITTTDKTKAVALRDTQLPAVKMTKGKYVQVMPIQANVDVIIQRHEYVGPEGIGYTDITELAKGDRRWTCANHVGPEKYRDRYNDVWTEATEIGVS